MFLSWLDVKMLIRSFLYDPFGVTREREVVFDGVRFLIRRYGSDLFIIREVFTRTLYGKPPRGIVVDLGANIGAYTLYAARSATRVIAIEPESSNYAQLQKNIALNNSLRVQTFKKAVGGINGSAMLSLGMVNKGASSLIFARSNKTETVETITLEALMSLCNITHIDFLKVDIEGSEYELFESASIELLTSISHIALETHRVSGKNVHTIVEKLERAGFIVRHTRTRRFFGMHMLFAHRDA